MIGWLSVYALHSTLLLCGVWLVDRLWRGAPPAVMVGLWRTALVAPVLTASLQTFGLVQPIADPVIIPAPIIERLEAAPAPAESLATAEVQMGFAVDWGGLVVGLWLVGAALLSLRAGIGWLSFRREIAHRTPLIRGPMLDRVQDLASQAGLRPVRVSVSDRIPCPLALPGREVCLPSGIEARFSHDQLDAMIAHEIAHLLRRDVPWLGISRALGALLFFQPLNRVARRRMIELGELAADDWARTRTGGGRALAECLASFAQDIAPRPLVYAACMAHERAGIAPRVRRLLAGPHSSGILSRAATLALALGAVALSVVMPGIYAQARAVTPAAEPSATPIAVLADAEEFSAMAASSRAVPGVLPPAPAPLPAGAGHTLARIHAAGRIGSDSKASAALRAVDLSRPLPGEVFAAYLDAARRIASDGEMYTALKPLVVSPHAPGGELLRAIQVAGAEIGSDSTLSNLLSIAAPRVGASQAMAEAYIEASTTISSDGEQADALVSLARQAQLTETSRKRIQALARNNPSRAHRERLLAVSSGR